MTSLLPKTRYFCRQCQEEKPVERFGWTFGIDRNGQPYPCARKICRTCLGEDGHKPCRTCEADKPIGEYYWVKSNSSDTRRPMPDCKDCWRELKNRRARGDGPPKVQRKRGPRPGTIFNGRKPPGWTPPPSIERLNEVHRQYSPPPGWTPIPGEECA